MRATDCHPHYSFILSFLSIKDAEKKICELTKAAKESLAFLGDKANDLCDLADYLAYRNN